MGSEAAHSVLRFAREKIPLHCRRASQPKPLVVESCVEAQRVELRHGCVGVHRVLQLSRAIIMLKEQSQTVFKNGAAAYAPLHAQPAVHVEALLPVWPHVLGGTGPLPSDSLA